MLAAERFGWRKEEDGWSKVLEEVRYLWRPLDSKAAVVGICYWVAGVFNAL